MCLFCGAAVGEEAALAVCPECEAQIEWVDSPLCTCCGRMFDVPGRRRPPLRRLPDGPAPLCPGPGRGAL